MHCDFTIRLAMVLRLAKVIFGVTKWITVQLNLGPSQKVTHFLTW
jgi:hypothetical protein